ncbi:hypothetical protein D3C81_1989330 [compost metagenome]
MASVPIVGRDSSEVRVLKFKAALIPMNIKGVIEESWPGLVQNPAIRGGENAGGNSTRLLPKCMSTRQC